MNRLLAFALPVVLIVALLSGGRIVSAGTDYPSYVAVLEPQTGQYSSNTIEGALVTPNTPPTGAPDFYTALLNTPLIVPGGSGGLLANDTDPDGDRLTANVVTPTTNGTLALGRDGGFTYTPNPGYAGPDSFTYTPDDGASDGNLTTVSISILAPPPPIPSSSPSPSDSASVGPSASTSASPPASISPSASSSPSASVSPVPSAGSPAPDAVVIQAFIEQDDAQAGETVYTDEETVGTTAAGDRRPATAGELTFVVVDSATDTILDEDSTDADGIVVLDAETDAPFFIYEVAEPDDGSYGSPDYLLTGDETLDVDVTRYVAVQPASAVASASAVVSDDGTSMPSAAPAASTGTSTLPNTGVGTAPRSGVSGTLLWLALFGTALALLGAGALRVRRR